jgi:two-component system sensor histidine kinase SenX3
VRRRSAARRLDAALSRIETGDEAGESGRGLGAVVDRVELAIGQAAGRVRDADDATTRLQAALDRVAQGVVVCDEHGVEVFRNEQARTLSDARYGDVLVERSLSDLLAAAASGEIRTETLELFGPPRRTLTITASPLDDGHRTVGAVAVVEDVSQRRRVDAIRRDFVANISHELKTPVGALGVVAETLADEDDPEVVRRLASRMHDEAMRLGRIVDDLLDLSRIEDEGEPRRDPLAVHLVVAQAIERMRSAADRRGITLQVSEADRQIGVSGDGRQLVSALYNLLENAVKYSDPGSTIDVDVMVSDDEAAVDISIVDRGIGIPARDLDRIFERFYRVDRARARDTGGTGLGLAIVRHVADNHGGSVLVTSHEGTGSTFTLRLPATSVASPPTRPRDPVSSDLRVDG